MMNRRTFSRALKAFRYYGLNVVMLSVITGIFAGVIVTFYTISTGYGEEYSVDLYRLLLEYPAFIPLLFVGLAAGAIAVGTLVKFVPMIRGSGIPQAEGACRGKVIFRWYVTLCSMFAASLACVFMGLAAGSEGPSVEIGCCVGEGTGRVLRRSYMIRRLQVAGGASAGFAVAFNAPVTGMIFAMEEAFKSFSPQVFISAAVSVITALGVRNGIRYSLGLKVGYAFEGFSFGETDIAGYGYIALASIIVALCAVAFYYLVFAAKKLFKKVTFLHGTGKYLIPFLLSGAFGLITVYAMGGGHAFIVTLGSDGGGTDGLSVWGAGLLVSLIVIVALRFVSMVLYMSCGVPCGVFVPMLAVGAGLGAILSVLFVQAGMSPDVSDYLIIVCMSVFFTTFVRAPVTGIALVFELTGQFTNLLPALLGAVIASLIAEVCRLEPGYERLLNQFVRDEGFNTKNKKITATVKIMAGSLADGGKINRMIWPSNGLVISVTDTDGSQVVPGGNTILRAGQTIVFECETSDREEVMISLGEIAGRQPEQELLPPVQPSAE